MRQVLQPQYCLGSPLLNLLHFLNVFLALGRPKLDAVFRCVGMSAEYRRKTLSLNLLAVTLLTQPWMLLAFLAAQAHRWLMPSSLSAATAGAFLLICSPARQAAPSLDRCRGLFLPSCRTCDLAVLVFVRFLLAHSSSLSGSPLMAVGLQGYRPFPHI